MHVTCWLGSAVCQGSTTLSSDFYLLQSGCWWKTLVCSIAHFIIRIWNSHPLLVFIFCKHHNLLCLFHVLFGFYLFFNLHVCGSDMKFKEICMYILHGDLLVAFLLFSSRLHHHKKNFIRYMYMHVVSKSCYGDFIFSVA